MFSAAVGTRSPKRTGSAASRVSFRAESPENEVPRLPIAHDLDARDGTPGSPDVREFSFRDDGTSGANDFDSTPPRPGRRPPQRSRRDAAPAWDFPLSRTEALRRVLLLCDAARREFASRLQAAEADAHALRELADEHRALQDEVTMLQVQRDRALCEVAILAEGAKAHHVPAPAEVKASMNGHASPEKKQQSEKLVLHSKAAPASSENGYASAAPLEPKPTPRAMLSAVEDLQSWTPRVAPRSTEVPPTPRTMARRLGIPDASARAGRLALRGSVAEVSWCVATQVETVVFTRRTTADQVCFGRELTGEPGEEVDGVEIVTHGPVTLRRGEYICAVSGRGSGADWHLASWLMLETSEGLMLTLGEPELDSDFRFGAKPGREIVGLQVGPDGRISGVKDAQLPPSRRALAAGAD
eukprot:gnl/TRDRNA2_/TRDRNA2_81818_c0_seq1.p1 gnl/TRDRNA2_/TRDRNA2_81818_c0~~gnl/TRDRNA2_/TRDRNA2_81818_c0_seq1.p1  ORF type:complete len:435 (-),score=67.11 gnl/TRDRNA2_/TRDRNA2_81818_c0_seq1:40-1281(-)